MGDLPEVVPERVEIGRATVVLNSAKILAFRLRVASSQPRDSPLVFKECSYLLDS